MRLAVGEDDENPYDGQEGTQVTATVTGGYYAVEPCEIRRLVCNVRTARLCCVESQGHFMHAHAAGTVWELKVKVGQSVKAGDTLVSLLNATHLPCCSGAYAPFQSS